MNQEKYTGLSFVEVVDTHTAGEPTRVVVAGGPDLGTGSMAERRERFRDEFDEFRSAIVNEPRGSDVWVGAILCEPSDARCAAGVIFFNNVGVLNMCGHGTIGLLVALGHLGRITAGTHSIETSVGVVTCRYDGRNRVSVENVPAYRHAKQVAVDVPGVGTLHGDVAWGGNWFFLCDDHGQTLDTSNIPKLLTLTEQIRRSLQRDGMTGADGGEIDHIELFGSPQNPECDSRNFVLCPGGAYDRSPCGTGTSAKVACLADDDKLQPDQTWRQESIIGSVFEASYRRTDENRIVPTITGEAFINAESKLVLDPQDPFCFGIRSN